LTVNDSVFDVNVQIFLERKFDDKHMKYKTRVMGWKQGQVVIVETPMLNGKHSIWYNNTECVLKFLNKGRIFVFDAKLLKVLDKPIPMLIFEYPKSLSDVDMRKFDRQTAHIECEIFSENDDKLSAESVIIVNYSPAGALIELTDPEFTVDISDVIKVDFTLPNGNDVKHLYCEVKNQKLFQNKVVIGAMFRYDNTEAYSKIVTFFA